VSFKRLVIVGSVVSGACGGPTAVPVPPLTTAQPAGRIAAAPAVESGSVARGDAGLVRQLAETNDFRFGQPTQATPAPDGKTVLFLRSGPRNGVQTLFETDVASGTTRELLTPASLLKEPESLSVEERARRQRMRVTSSGFTSFELSKDGTKVLLGLSGRLFVFTRASGAARELETGEGAALVPHFAPDGRRVYYVRASDLFAIGVEPGAREIALTRGGTAEKTHGLAEFVAEEELDRFDGYWVSPDGSRVAYETSDTSKVEKLAILDPAHPEAGAEKFPYPRPGKTNADVMLSIASTRGGGGAPILVRWDRERYPYLAQASWQPGAPLTLYVMSRVEKDAALLAVDETTGATRVLLTEHDDAWLNVDPTVPRWLPDGSGFAWSSERTGAWQLEWRDAKGALVRAITPREAGYRALVDLDPKARRTVVLASADPVEQGVLATPIDGGDGSWVMHEPRSFFRARFGEGHDVFVASASSAERFPTYLVRRVDAPESRPIPSSMETPSITPRIELAEVGPERFRVAVLRPSDFDRSKRYPVIDAAYAGPTVAIVTAESLEYLRAQWMADEVGAIVVVIDAKGTPNRGRDWERALAGKLGAVPLEGHVAALQALAARYPEMDLSRVGVFGWSFGGYFSALAVLRRPDVYRAAFAGAPPADWRDYDTAYTERYLGLPDPNAAAYDDASLLTWAKKPLASGRPPRLFVAHGTADDNVYFQHSLKLADALERAHRPFELMPLEGVTHLPVDPDLLESLYLRGAAVLRGGLEEPSKKLSTAAPP
jgi:dipeptidyl-peptidase 4